VLKWAGLQSAPYDRLAPVGRFDELRLRILQARSDANIDFDEFVDLKEKGRLHFFYHSPLSSLPIRDVTDEQGAGCKTEPYLERQAENYLNPCNQRNILGFLESDEKYLLLFTKCKKRDDESHFNRMYVVGYLLKERWLDRRGFYAAMGRTKMFSFDDAFELRGLPPVENPRHVRKKLSARENARILEGFERKRDIAGEWRRCVCSLKKSSRRK